MAGEDRADQLPWALDLHSKMAVIDQRWDEERAIQVLALACEVRSDELGLIEGAGKKQTRQERPQTVQDQAIPAPQIFRTLNPNKDFRGCGGHLHTTASTPLLSSGFVLESYLQRCLDHEAQSLDSLGAGTMKFSRAGTTVHCGQASQASHLLRAAPAETCTVSTTGVQTP